MKQIIIIGNSAAGIAAAEAIRERDKDARIVLFSDEGSLAYDRPRILKFLEGKVRERELIYRNQDFYKNLCLDLVLDGEVAGVNVNKKNVVLRDRDREPVPFDELVIATGRRPVKPSLKGVQKDGVIAFGGLKDVKAIMEYLPVAHTVLVVGPGPIAEETARLIAEKRVEVKFFGPPARPIEGVEAVVDNPILEILGESEVKAVRLSSQKVVGASMVIFAGEPVPCVEFLRDSGIALDQGVLVDASGRTNVPFVYAVGDVAQPAEGPKVYGWANAVSQGALLGRRSDE